MYTRKVQQSLFHRSLSFSFFLRHVQKLTLLIVPQLSYAKFSHHAVPYQKQLKVIKDDFSSSSPFPECVPPIAMTSERPNTGWAHLTAIYQPFLWWDPVQPHHSTPVDKSARPEDDHQPKARPEGGTEAAAVPSYTRRPSALLTHGRQDARSWFGRVLDGVPITDHARAHQSLRR